MLRFTACFASSNVVLHTGSDIREVEVSLDLFDCSCDSGMTKFRVVVVLPNNTFPMRCWYVSFAVVNRLS